MAGFPDSCLPQNSFPVLSVERQQALFFGFFGSDSPNMCTLCPQLHFSPLSFDSAILKKIAEM